MAREPSARVIPSLLDRLIDREPQISTEAPNSQRQSLRELKESVRLDLERLLNTRRVADIAPASRKYLSRSIYNYGLPDFTSVPLKTEDDKRRMSRILESAIAMYEPRLSHVNIAIASSSGPSRVLLFQIEAMLRVDPAPERVFFDAKLELSTSQYHVGGEQSAK